MNFHLLIVNLSVCAKDSLFRKSILVLLSSRLFPTFSSHSTRFSLFVFRLRSLIHYDLSFVSSAKIYFESPSSLTNSICWKCCITSTVNFWILYPKKRCLYMYGFMSKSSNWFSWTVCWFRSQKKYYFYYYVFIVKLEIRDVDTSNSSFYYSGLFYSACFIVFAGVQFFSSISESFYHAWLLFSWL